MAVGRGIWIGIAIVLVVIIAVSSYAVLYYPKGNVSVNQTSNSHTTSPTQSSSQSIQESGTVSSVDSEGGHFSITNVGLGNPMWVSLSSSQVSLAGYGQDVEIRMTYAPLQRGMFDTMGKVISMSTTGATIALLNSTMPTTVPVAWNPKVGGGVVLTINPETVTPLVVITGYQFKAVMCNEWTSTQCLNSTTTTQFAAFVGSPTCLGQESLCVMEATGQPFVIGFSFSNQPFCPSGCTLSVTTDSSGFSVSNVHQVDWEDITVTLMIPSTDFVGALHLTFVYTPS